MFIGMLRNLCESRGEGEEGGRRGEGDASAGQPTYHCAADLEAL